MLATKDSVFFDSPLSNYGLKQARNPAGKGHGTLGRSPRDAEGLFVEEQRRMLPPHCVLGLAWHGCTG